MLEVSVSSAASREFVICAHLGLICVSFISFLTGLKTYGSILTLLNVNSIADTGLAYYFIFIFLFLN